jgi:hypothetical protein
MINFQDEFVENINKLKNTKKETNWNAVRKFIAESDTEK